MPQDGFFQERVRSIKAIAEYNGEEPNEAELKEATSSSSVEQAVGKTANRVAHTLACCIASYVAPRAPNATIFFDPISKGADRVLHDALRVISCHECLFVFRSSGIMTRL